MNNLKKHIAAAFESAPAVCFRHVKIDALLQELQSAVNNPGEANEIGRHVLALVSAHLKSGFLAEKAVMTAKGR